MKNDFLSDNTQKFYSTGIDILSSEQIGKSNNDAFSIIAPGELPEILFITSYPPRECGIATYSQDLIKSLKNKFRDSFKISICALESVNEQHTYHNEDVKYILNVDQPNGFVELARTIKANDAIKIVMVQHEFGFFAQKENEFIRFLEIVEKPVSVVFHTVLPNPSDDFKIKVQKIAGTAASIVVMTTLSKKILEATYGIDSKRVSVISHGTHLVKHVNRDELKAKYGLTGKKVLSTFGLLSSGKSIETTLNALPSIVEKNKDVVFLIIGKTHPSVAKSDGEAYRDSLKAIIANLNLQSHVVFINHFLSLPELLEYLQLTDIYLFTSKDPNQAVSGTFAYAMSCGCAIVSTPIPHVREVIQDDAGILFDFGNSEQLGVAVNTLLSDDALRNHIASKALHRMSSTVWENSAIAHAQLFVEMYNATKTEIADVNDALNRKQFIYPEKFQLKYSLPKINLDHVKAMTTPFGMIQFAKINQPDIATGYTIDDNARAMVAMAQHYELTRDVPDLDLIRIYLNYIHYCLQPDGNFLNYVDVDTNFTQQNDENLEDSNGRAIWALGYLISLSDILPVDLTEKAESILQNALRHAPSIHSTRAMAFIIKGLYYRNLHIKSAKEVDLLVKLTNRLVAMFRCESEKNWVWFESYLTYGNSILPEAMLCAYLTTGETIYKEVAKASFDFLLEKTFSASRINVISNKTWLKKSDVNNARAIGGEQPIDIAYTIMALSKFYDVFREVDYKRKMEIAFSWFLGNNHLNQIIYNPCTGGCFDGLEDAYVNLNQGAESTVSYLMARLTVEKHQKTTQIKKRPRINQLQMR